MNFNFLPIEEKRRTIMLLPSNDLNELESESDFIKDCEDKQVHLLNTSTTNSHVIIQTIKKSGFFNPRSLLIQSPYNPSDYAPLLDAPYTFAQAKCFHFSTLCGLLGAQKVVVEQMEVQTTEGNNKFSGSLNTPYGKGGIEWESRAWERMRKDIKLEQEFEGGEPDLDAAKDYLNEYQLLNDTSMTNLVTQRSYPGIRTKSFKFSLSVSRESQRNLKGALSLKVPTYLDLLQGQVEQIKKEFLLFSLTIKVEF